MAWSGKERRKQPRPSGDPTYIVEKDAPDWTPPQPFWARWRRNAADFARQNRYDAYPDHERPFEDIESHLPVPERLRTPKARHGEVYLMVVGRKHARLVPLAGTSLDHIDLGRRMVQGWVLGAIHRTMLEVMVLDEEDDKGQGLAEYALILALVAIVAIAALLVMGDQINAVFDRINGQIPGSTPAP